MPNNDAEPRVDPQTLQFRRALPDPEKGITIFERMRSESKERLAKQAAIARKFNDEAPWRQQKLNEAGQGWRRNASTGFMSSMVKRVVPAYEQMIDNAQYLTTARMPGGDTITPETTQKETHHHFEITKCIRGWKGWGPFKGQVCLENVLYGYTGAGRTDPYTWEPIFLRQDETFFPDGCPQDASKVPLWCYEQPFLIHELAAYLVDPQASADAGWDIDEIVDSINNAMPENRSGSPYNERKREDVIRDSSLGTSYSEGVKVVKAVHLFIQEASGLVSHYIYNIRSKKLLFMQEDQFENMESTLALIAIEVGDGKLHGSKGAGRILYNTHVSIEQARNLITDNLYLAGLIILRRTDENNGKNNALSVIHPVCIIGKGFEVVEHSFQINTDAYFAIDRQHTQIAELQIGAFMPGQITDTSGEKRTASEINYVASIESQLRQGLLARFWQQFQMIIWESQKRICSIDNITKAFQQYQQEQSGLFKRFSQGVVNLMRNIGQQLTGNIQIVKADPISDSGVKCCLNLLRKGLTPQEIYELGQAPSFDLTTDTAQDLSTAMGAISAKYKGDPNVNQHELVRRDIAATVGEELADVLVIAEEDNTLTAEATRQQLIELSVLTQGEPVPISPRDFDPVHLQVLQQKSSNLLSNPAAVTAQTLPIFQNILGHAQAHLQQAIQKVGGDKSKFTQYIQFVTMAEKFLEAAEANMKGQPIHPTGMTPNGGTVAPPPPDAASGPQSMPPAGAVTPPPLPNANGADPVPASLGNTALAAEQKPLSRGPVNITPQ